MTCSEFMESFSSFVDGEADARLRASMEAHLDACPECERYHDVYLRGISLLRSFPEVSVDDEFDTQLEVRLRRDTRAALRRLGYQGPSSGSSMALVFGMAVVLVGVAWVPFLFGRTAQVELPPIVAAYPTRGLPMELPEIRLLEGVNRPRTISAGLGAGSLFDDPSILLREYAPVMQGYGAGRMMQADLQ